ncbi:hypothetical protein H2201_003445 [Coniosporium apollinis]|uniref:UDENN FLCN/SMCR8-type domain-containing protein n=1 Tax=Coniosporium apollinis TaxID=61459 RepID=A0ABQ9NWN9_9PEZI|nr:hypothetical protein H2201_003445 [Coniosporium apollinis]
MVANRACTQISLAHFCELHGPTSILCTQTCAATCPTCRTCDTPPSDDPPNSSYSSFDAPWDAKFSSQVPPLSSPFETPPTSPKQGSYNPYFPSFSGEREIYKRFSKTFEDDADSCENCAFLVPRNVSDRLPAGAPGSPSKDGRSRNGSPVLRTSQAVLAHSKETESDNDSDGIVETVDVEQSLRSPAFPPSPPSTTTSSPPSPLFVSQTPHTHTLTYITTRQPTSASAYSLLRRSCIRTLSCEMLPRGSPSGPLVFGDPVAGYTIAYIFRLPDPRARGKLRTYALIALGGRDSWRVGKAMVKVTEIFESVASKIIAMADRVLERESSASSRPSTSERSTPPLSCSASIMSNLSSRMSPEKKGVSPTQSSPVTRTITPVSSFLSAKKVDPDGYPRVSREVMRAKGLAEIVGKDDFFVELHATFCMLLSGLIKEFGS